MTFDLPNYNDTTYPEQARLYAADLQMLTQTASLTGTKSGLQVAAQGSPNMTVQVGSGEIYWLNSVVAVAAGNLTITPAHALHPRVDLVVVDLNGTKSVVAGTPAAVATEPALPANSVAIAQVTIPANDTTISTGQIKDRRIVVQMPSVAGSSVLVRKTAVETVTSSTVLQDDDHLRFAMSSNGRWAVKVFVWATSASNGAMKFFFTGPTGSTWRMTCIATGSTATLSSEATGTTFQTSGIGTNPVAVLMEGVAYTGATSGDFRLQWAQAVSNASGHTVGINSYLEYQPLP